MHEIRNETKEAAVLVTKGTASDKLHTFGKLEIGGTSSEPG
jgi:hypothetical protein